MINKKKEGGFYASKVRLFLNEYDGIPLEEFCKAEKVSYNKMLNCLGRTNHQYHPVGKPKSDKPIKAVEPDRPLLPSLELKELVIDKPGEQEPAKEDLSRLTLIKPCQPRSFVLIEGGSAHRGKVGSLGAEVEISVGVHGSDLDDRHIRLRGIGIAVETGQLSVAKRAVQNRSLYRWLFARYRSCARNSSRYARRRPGRSKTAGLAEHDASAES